jgi:hypothetical protein
VLPLRKGEISKNPFAHQVAGAPPERREIFLHLVDFQIDVVFFPPPGGINRGTFS